MTDHFVLYYAPDNASQPVMMALELLGVAYDRVLVDRAARAQQSPAYLALNPHGRIPVLETPDGTLFETGAILLWLADRYGRLAPPPDSRDRANFLKWFFFASNTLHSDLIRVFYLDRYGPADAMAQMHAMATASVAGHWARIEMAAADGVPGLCQADVSVLDLYLASMARWSALYPTDRPRDWFDLDDYPTLRNGFARLESLDALGPVAQVDGLAAHPFTNPKPARPSQGSAL